MHHAIQCRPDNTAELADTMIAMRPESLVAAAAAAAAAAEAAAKFTIGTAAAAAAAADRSPSH